MIISSKICCLAFFLSWQGRRLLLNMTKLAAANSIFKIENNFHKISAEQAVYLWILLCMNHYELTIMLAGSMRCDKNFLQHKNTKINCLICRLKFLWSPVLFRWMSQEDFSGGGGVCVCVCGGGGERVNHKVKKLLWAKTFQASLKEDIIIPRLKPDQNLFPLQFPKLG